MPNTLHRLLVNEEKLRWFIEAWEEEKAEVAERDSFAALSEEEIFELLPRLSRLLEELLED